jgi:hypothetical protein
VQQLRRQELERDGLLEMQVCGADDHTHPTSTDHAIDAILTCEYSPH